MENLLEQLGHPDPDGDVNGWLAISLLSQV
jgi:hypothetical protein